MINQWLKRKRQNPRTSLVIFGTEFGSYQFLQLVQSSSKYEVAGFISNDPWQQRSGFGKIGVVTPGQLASFCTEHSVAAIVVTSDQREDFEKSGDMEPVRSQDLPVQHCDVLSIPQMADRETADRYIDQLALS